MDQIGHVHVDRQCTMGLWHLRRNAGMQKLDILSREAEKKESRIHQRTLSALCVIEYVQMSLGCTPTQDFVTVRGHCVQHLMFSNK